MKARVIITYDGQVEVFAAEGTFKDGKRKIEDFLAWLEAGGMALESRSEVEQHRHDDPPDPVVSPLANPKKQKN